MGLSPETGGSFPVALMTATLSLLDVLGLERCATTRLVEDALSSASGHRPARTSMPSAGPFRRKHQDLLI